MHKKIIKNKGNIYTLPRLQHPIPVMRENMIIWNMNEWIIKYTAK